MTRPTACSLVITKNLDFDEQNTYIDCVSPSVLWVDMVAVLNNSCIFFGQSVIL